MENTNQITWNEYISLINSFGYPIKLISHNEWIKKLSSIQEDNSLFKLKSLFLEQNLASHKNESGQRNLESFIEHFRLKIWNIYL